MFKLLLRVLFIMCMCVVVYINAHITVDVQEKPTTKKSGEVFRMRTQTTKSTLPFVVWMGVAVCTDVWSYARR